MGRARKRSRGAASEEKKNYKEPRTTESLAADSTSSSMTSMGTEERVLAWRAMSKLLDSAS